MKGRVFLVHWNSKEARKKANELRDEGWIVECETNDSNSAFTRIKNRQPDAVVINLDRWPSHGCEVGFTLKAIKITRRLPVLFVDGDKGSKKQARERVPKARFTKSKELPKRLEKYSKSDEENN